MPLLEVKNLSASYGNYKVLENINLSVEKGEIVSLIGSSGSGKSTLLRVLMGLLKPSTGHVTIDGQTVNYGSSASLKSIRDRMAIPPHGFIGIFEDTEGNVVGLHSMS